MKKRFLSIWFPSLLTDWMIIRRPEWKSAAVVSVSASHGRMMVTAANSRANIQGIHTGMPLADARALVHNLEVFDDKAGRKEKLLEGLARWAIRYTPLCQADGDGLLLDISGCAHLWGGEDLYLKQISCRLQDAGYLIQTAIASTIGTAWALARYGKGAQIADPYQELSALLPLPPAALRLEEETTIRLHKLGLNKIERFIQMPGIVIMKQ